MDYVQDIYVVRNRVNGYYLNAYSLSTYQTYSKDLWCAMLFPDSAFAKHIMEIMKLSEQDYYVDKFLICKPTTEEIS